MSLKEGAVAVDYHRTRAECSVCGKSIRYKSPTTLEAWTKLLKEFIVAHRNCRKTGESK